MELDPVEFCPPEAFQQVERQGRGPKHRVEIPKSMGMRKNAIIPSMFLRSTCVLALVCVCCRLALTPGPVQSPVVIDDDIRVFTMVAALNVAGFDVELASQYHPVRAEIRKIADTLDPALVQRMREFYSSHKSRRHRRRPAREVHFAGGCLDGSSGVQARRARRGAAGRRAIRPGFCSAAPGVLSEGRNFETVGEGWSFYEAEMDRLGPSIRDAIARTDSYLRAQSAGRHQPDDEDQSWNSELPRTA